MKKIFKKVSVKNVLVGTLAIVGIAFIGLGVYRGFLMDFTFWQNWFCLGQIESIRQQGYLMMAGGCICLTGSAAYQFESKVKNFESRVKSWFNKKKATKEEIIAE